MAAFMSKIHEDSQGRRREGMLIDWLTFKDTLISWVNFHAP
jgi:hypothetical protein